MLNFFLKKINYIKIFPFLTIIFFILLSSTIHPPTGYAMTFSFMPVICIVFWGLLLGKFLNNIHCFFIGIFTDLLHGTPLGSYILLFAVIMFLSIQIRNRFRINSFIKNIMAAYFLIFIFFILKNFFFMFYYSKIIFTEYIILNIMATLFLYPGFAVLFNWIYKVTAIKKYYVET